MPFPFAIRKLKKILNNEQLLAVKGADRFAKARVLELKEAIEKLSDESIKTKAVQPTKQPTANKPKTQLNLFP